MTIEIRHSKLATILNPDSDLETVVTGFAFTEGPIWHPHEHHLIFSDIPTSKMYRVDTNQNVTVFRDPSNKANGNAYDHMGRVLTCEHVSRRVVRQELDGTLATLASHYQGKELNSPNDIIVKSNGAIYFTDPTYGRSEYYGQESPRELDFQGVFMLNPESGELTLLVDDFEQPNGLCFSVDEQQLYVADTPRKHIRVFDVLPDGTLEGGEVWATTEGEGHTLPDGLKVDTEGNIFSCGPGGVHIFAPNGNLLGIIHVPEHTANFAWGDLDLCSFYITASTSIYRVRTHIPGLEIF